MKYIKEYVDGIADELNDAKDYAEKSLYYKSKDDVAIAKQYSEMAQDELKHAKQLHDLAVIEINDLTKIYKPTEDMRQIWESSHNYYVEQFAWIKQMLSM